MLYKADACLHCLTVVWEYVTSKTNQLIFINFIDWLLQSYFKVWSTHQSHRLKPCLTAFRVKPHVYTITHLITSLFHQLITLSSVMLSEMNDLQRFRVTSIQSSICVCVYQSWTHIHLIDCHQEHIINSVYVIWGNGGLIPGRVCVHTFGNFMGLVHCGKKVWVTSHHRINWK